MSTPEGTFALKMTSKFNASSVRRGWSEAQDWDWIMWPFQLWSNCSRLQHRVVNKLPQQERTCLLMQETQV